MQTAAPADFQPIQETEGQVNSLMDGIMVSKRLHISLKRDPFYNSDNLTSSGERLVN